MENILRCEHFFFLLLFFNYFKYQRERYKKNCDLRRNWRFSHGLWDFGVCHYEFANFSLSCQGTI